MTTIERIIKASRGDKPTEPLIFEKHIDGTCGVDFPPLDVPETELEAAVLGKGIDLPSFQTEVIPVFLSILILIFVEGVSLFLLLQTLSIAFDNASIKIRSNPGEYLIL